MPTKTFRFDWSYLERLDEVEPASLDGIRLLLRMVATSEQRDPLHTFFELALAPHFEDPTGSGRCPPGLPALVGNVLYRLSDLVPLARRESLDVHPHEDGRGFITLEDWRGSWVLRYKKGEEDIPYFAGDDPIDLPGNDDGR